MEFLTDIQAGRMSRFLLSGRVPVPAPEVTRV